MRIAEPFKLPGGEVGVDLWPAFRSLAATPTLLVRGELSDLLSVETVARMKAEHPKLEMRHRSPRRPRPDARRAGSGGGDRPAAGEGDGVGSRGFSP